MLADAVSEDLTPHAFLDKLLRIKRERREADQDDEGRKALKSPAFLSIHVRRGLGGSRNWHLVVGLSWRSRNDNLFCANPHPPTSLVGLVF